MENQKEESKQKCFSCGKEFEQGELIVPIQISFHTDMGQSHSMTLLHAICNIRGCLEQVFAVKPLQDKDRAEISALLMEVLNRLTIEQSVVKH